MRIIGEAQQQWAPLRRKYNLSVYRCPSDSAPNILGMPGQRTPTDHNSRQISFKDLPSSNSNQLHVLQAPSHGNSGQYNQFAYVDEPFLSWDFSLLSPDSRLIGSVNRNFAGFARELFTDTGVYALRMDAASLVAEPQHLISKTGKNYKVAQKTPEAGMTLDQRAVMLACAVSIDFDYFSRKSGSGGFMPLWFPWWGGGTAGEAAGGVVATETAGGAIGGVEAGSTARGVSGIGSPAIGGAASVAGYDAMQGGRHEGNASPNTSPAEDSTLAPSEHSPVSQRPVTQDEEVWGETSDNGGGGRNGSREGGGYSQGGDGRRGGQGHEGEDFWDGGSDGGDDGSGFDDFF